MAKHALLVGINEYSNPSFNLRGCVNDCESLARLLSDVYGFKADDIELLLDKRATRLAIMTQLDAMLSTCRSGDTVVFAFSGHGTQVPSTEPAELDFKDECLVPYEGSSASLLKDNELAAVMQAHVADDIKFTAIYDCCHSGTVLRTLGFDSDGAIVEDVINRCLDFDLTADFRTREFSIAPYNVLSACRDDETAADVREAGRERMPRGAFSYALHEFLRANKDVPIGVAEAQIAASIGAISKHKQTPSYALIDMSSPLIRF